MTRKYYLDNLKVFLTVLVIFHHAGQAYWEGANWAYTPSNPAETMPWIWHFFAVNAAFFMGLFFLISGYFVPTSYDKQGGKVFVMKKLTHLGIPLLILSVLLTTFTGQLEVAHLWFVESLLFFCITYALLRQFVKPITDVCSSKPTFIGIINLGLVMGIGCYFIRQVSPQDHWIWLFGFLHIEPAHYLQYVMLFILGILANRFNWLEKLSNTTGAISLLTGTMLAIGIYVRNGGWWNDFVTEWFGIYESLLCVFICFGLLWLFRQAFNRSSTFMQWCATQAYGAYIVHLLLMLGIQFATDTLWMGAFGKFMFIGITSTIISFTFAWFLRCIPGVKRIF